MNPKSDRIASEAPRPTSGDRLRTSAASSGTLVRASHVLTRAVAVALCMATALLADFTKQPDETLPGFKSEQVYDFGSVDSVNLYSGEAHVAIPLGPEYPLSSGLSWRLTAHYSSKNWHMFQYDSGIGSSDCPGMTIPVQRAHLGGYSTLGIGWTLELGYVRPGRGDSQPVYVSPDGARHTFVGLSRDTDLRLDLQGDGTYFVRRSDGTVLKFTHLYEIPAPANGFDFSDEDRPGAPVNDASRQTRRYGLTSMVDRFGNTVLQVTYAANCASTPCPANAWRVSSVQLANPTRTINFNWGQYTSSSGTYAVVNSIDFPAVGGGVLTASFAFRTDGTLSRSGFDSQPAPPQGLNLPVGPTTTNVPILASITQSSQAYSFDYDTTTYNGVLRSMTLPTGGTISYAYRSFTVFYPQRCGTGGTCVPEVDGASCPAAPEPDAPVAINAVDRCTDLARKQPFMDLSPSVISRTEQDPWGLSSTTYYDRRQYGSAVGAGQPVEPDRVVRRVIVNRPDGNGNNIATKYVFASALDGLSGPELSRRYYGSCDSGGAPVRSVVQCFPAEQTLGHPEPWACGVMESSTQIASLIDVTFMRPNRQITWYGENPLVPDDESCNPSNATPCWQDVYSGLNEHASEYRTVTRSANRDYLIYPQTATRTTTTLWSADSGTDNAIPWLPKLYSSKTATDAPCYYAPCSVTTTYSFNVANGFLNSSWVTDPTYGTVTESRGMDSASGDPLTDSLAASFDSGTTFTDTRTFQSGLATSARRTAPVASPAIGWKSFDVTRDATTGLITTSRDPNLLATTYTYDSLSRLQSVNPPEELATTYCYVSWNASTNEMPTVFAKRGGSSCAESDGVPGSNHGPFDAYQYDGLGRVRREMRRLPNPLSTGSYFSFRETRYNAAGLIAFQSEWVPCGVSQGSTSVRSCFAATTTKGTTFSNFDFLGRARTIRLADASVITKSFDDPGGIPNSDFTEMVSRSVGGVTVNSGSRKDILGRLLVVGEPAPAPAPFGLLTDYRYNVLDKLVEVRVGTSSGDPNDLPPFTPQTRSFTYDAHGLLRSETHPEKGSTTYTAFNALGSIKAKAEGGINYSYSYDPLGRPKETIAAGQTLLSNTYDEPLDATGAPRGSSKGKLTTSQSSNAFPSGAPVVPWNDFHPGGTISDSYTYTGLGGRLSQKTTTLSNGNVSPVQSWIYNSLGLVATEYYPRVPLTGTFSVTTGYVNGLPRTLTAAGQTVASSVTYDPAGALASYTSGNGVTTTIAQDTSGMPRPRQISTSNGSFSTGLYAYDGSGNITSIGPDLFTYDANSRLLSAAYPSGTQNYGFDRWGNLTQKAGTSIPVDPATNRLTGAAYDSRGNLTVLGGETYSYDALNRQARHDAPTSHWAYLFDPASERIVKAIPPGNDLSFNTILRRHIARVVLQGEGETPRMTFANYFTDVPATDPERGWIERFYELGYAAGCGGGRYCPDNPTTRIEMAVFLAAADAPGGVVPQSGTIAGAGSYNCVTGGASLFTDVAPDHWGCPYVHYLLKEGITAGCQGPPNRRYCPNDLTTHWMMEVFADRIWPGFRYIPPSATYSFRGVDGSIRTEFQDSAVSKDYVYLGSRLVGTKDTSSWKYNVTDHLGSVRLTMQAPLSPQGRKYWPWGEEVATPGVETLGFAGMEQDFETSRPRYYDHARNLETGFGRFLSPDVLSGKPEDPQSWNRYAYARNNPLKYVDPDGKEPDLAIEALQGERDAGRLTFAQYNDRMARRTEAMAAAAPYALTAAAAIAGGMVVAEAAPIVIARGIAALSPGLVDVRRTYLAAVSGFEKGIAEARAAGATAEQIARQFVPMRNEVKALAREGQGLVSRTVVELRNLAVYGNKLGPTADQLYKKYGSWEKVVEKILQTNEKVNRIVPSS